MCTVVIRVPESPSAPTRVLAIRDEDPERPWNPLGRWWPEPHDGVVGVRMGALHGDPEVEPQWRQWLSSAPDWVAVPDDGLPADQLRPIVTADDLWADEMVLRIAERLGFGAELTAAVAP